MSNYDRWMLSLIEALLVTPPPTRKGGLLAKMAHLIGVYGTLKRGEYNNDPKWPMLGRSTIRGAMTLCHGSYPKLWKPAEWNADHVREHELQILQVDDQMFDSINLMEEHSGYSADTITREINGKEHPVTVFWAQGRPNFEQPWIEEFPVS